MLFHHRSFFAVRILLTLALLAGLFITETVTPVRAATIAVPDDYQTIQSAINAASPGDTIFVRPGTYTENLTISKPITLTAAAYDSSDPTHNTTIISGKSSRKPVIVIPAGVSPAPTVRGFVLRNGREGIIISSDAVIEYNYFVGLADQIDVTGGGGGIIHHNVFFDSSDDAIDLDNMNRPLLIEYNRMMYNRDDGIEARLQDATAPVEPIMVSIHNNQIIGCQEDGIQFIDYSQAIDTKRAYIITGNLIANCQFAGIGLMGNANSTEDYSGADILESIQAFNNTIYGNNYGISGGDHLIAYNNIIANSATRGVWRVQDPAGVVSAVAYTLFYNNGVDAEQSTLGAGNKFGQNPLFAYAPTAGPDGAWRTADDDFLGLALQAGSPAMDAGYDPICPASDLRGVARPQNAHCDLGAFEGPTAPGPWPPAAASLIFPTGDVPGPWPVYTWNPVADATWYYLWVNGASGNVIKQWYPASHICNASTCSITPSTGLRSGAHTWWIQAWNSAGYGPWSDGLSFFVSLPPGKASLGSPSGAITEALPTFSWSVSPVNDTADAATWYYLWVNGLSGNVIKQWYQASSICNASTCSVTSSIPLRGGVHTWWVQTWNSAGYGPWSDSKSFSLPLPAAATLISPSGSTTDTTPTYAWNKVTGVAWYYLWVDGPSGNLIKTWYESSAVCGASTCSVTPDVTLSGGFHSWWIQTWNEMGYGPWSSRKDFTVGP